MKQRCYAKKLISHPSQKWLDHCEPRENGLCCLDCEGIDYCLDRCLYAKASQEMKQKVCYFYLTKIEAFWKKVFRSF